MVILAMADEPQGTLFGDAPDFEGATLPAKVPALGYLAALARRAIPETMRPWYFRRVEGFLEARRPGPPAAELPVGPGFAHAAGEVPLLKTLVRTIRAIQYSIRTEQAYVDWCRRFLAFRGDAPTARLGVEEGSAS